MTVNLKKLSTKQLNALIKKNNTIVANDTKAIKKLNSQATADGKKASTAASSISKVSKKASKLFSTYKKDQSKVTAAEAKYKSAKTKAAKAKAKKALASAKKSLNTVTSSLKKTSSKVSGLLSTYNKSLAAQKKAKASSSSKTKAKAALNKQTASAKKIVAPANNLTSAKNKIAKQLKKTGVGHSSLSSADGSTSAVVFLMNSNESEANQNTVTQYPVAKGDPTTDHSARSSKTDSITAMLLGSNFQSQWNQLLSWNYSGSLLKYSGAGTAKWNQVVISELDRAYEQPLKNALNVTLTLTYVQIVAVQTTKKKKVAKKGKKQPAGKKKSTKKYVKVKSGDTYWGFWKKYGTSIATLEKWNKYPARRIPIGVKLRVK